MNSSNESSNMSLGAKILEFVDMFLSTYITVLVYMHFNSILFGILFFIGWQLLLSALLLSQSTSTIADLCANESKMQDLISDNEWKIGLLNISTIIVLKAFLHW